MTSGQAFVAMDHLLDNAIIGPLYLKRPELAMMIADAIRFQHGLQYELHAYCVMANHVHLLITPRINVAKLMHSLKRFTATKGNAMLGLTGKRFWQDESYDRLVRDDREFENIVRYIEWNPVKAGLVRSPEEFSWSSAGGRLEIVPQVTNLPHES